MRQVQLEQSKKERSRGSIIREFLSQLEGYDEALKWLSNYNGFCECNRLSEACKRVLREKDPEKIFFKSHENMEPFDDVAALARYGIWQNQETWEIRVCVGRFDAKLNPKTGPRM